MRSLAIAVLAAATLVTLPDHASAGTHLLGEQFSSTSPPTTPSYSGRSDDRSKEVVVEGELPMATIDSSGSNASGEASEDRYLRADATACLTFDDLEAVQAITTAPGACPQNTTEAQITPACDG
ncbi:hypothetical protein, partial [Isoptericola sp. NPDC055881]